MSGRAGETHCAPRRLNPSMPRKLGFTEVGQRAIDPPPLAGTGIGVVWRLVR